MNLHLFFAQKCVLCLIRTLYAFLLPCVFVKSLYCESRERSDLTLLGPPDMFYRVWSPVTFDLKSQTHFLLKCLKCCVCGDLPRMHFKSLFIFSHVSHNVSKDVRDRVLLPESNFRRLEMLSACRSATAQIRRPRQQSMLGSVRRS